MTSFLERVFQQTTSYTTAIAGILVVLMLYKYEFLDPEMTTNKISTSAFVRNVVTFKILFSATVFLLIVRTTGTMHMWTLVGLLAVAAVLSLQNY